RSSRTCTGVAAMALAAQLLAGCSSGPPDSSSPVPEPVPGPGVAADALLDVSRAEPTWFDPGTRQVMRLRGGVVQPGQHRASFPEITVGSWSMLRVLDDDTVAAVAGPGIVLYPADGSPPEVEAFDNLGAAVDGTSLHDVWYATEERIAPFDYRLCH